MSGGPNPSDQTCSCDRCAFPGATVVIISAVLVSSVDVRRQALGMGRMLTTNSWTKLCRLRAGKDATGGVPKTGSWQPCRGQGFR